MRTAKRTSRRLKRFLLSLSLLVVTVLLATVVASRVRAAKPGTDVEATPALPKTMAPKDTTPPANVQNLRRTDTVDMKAVTVACEPQTQGPVGAK